MKDGRVGDNLWVLYYSSKHIVYLCYRHVVGGTISQTFTHNREETFLKKQWLMHSSVSSLPCLLVYVFLGLATPRLRDRSVANRRALTVGGIKGKT